MSASTQHLFLLSLIVLIGGGLRLAVAWKGDGYINHDYYTGARHLKQSGIFSLGPDLKPTAYRGIVYPGLIAALQPSHVADWTPRRIYLVQALLGTLSIWIVYACGALAISPGSGLVAAGLFALDPMQVFTVNQTEIAAMYSFILTCVCGVLVWWAHEATPKRSFILGAVVGVCVLCRPVLRLFPLYLLILCSRRELFLPRLKRNAWVMLAGFSLVLSPWITRNALQFGKFIPFNQAGGSALHYMASFGMIHGMEETDFEAMVKNLQGSYPKPREAAGERAMDSKDARYVAIRDAAVSRILQHPWPYFRSLFLRSLIYAPFLFLFPWLAVRRWPDNPKVFALAALFSYMSIHLFTAIFLRYITVNLFIAFILLGGFVVQRNSALADPEICRVPNRLGLFCAAVLAGIYLVALYWIGMDLKGTFHA